MSLSGELATAHEAQLCAVEKQTSISAPPRHTKAPEELIAVLCLAVFFQGKCWGRAGSSEAQGLGLDPKKTKHRGLKALN